jgi:hypothetical protein
MSQPRQAFADSHWRRPMNCIGRHQGTHQTSGVEGYGVCKSVYDSAKTTGYRIDDKLRRYDTEQSRRKIGDQAIEHGTSRRYDTDLKSPIAIVGTNKVHWLTMARSESDGRLTRSTGHYGNELLIASSQIFNIERSTVKHEQNLCSADHTEQYEKLRSKYLKLPGSYVSSADSHIKNLLSKMTDTYSGSLKTSGYRCGDGPSEHCQKPHYIRDYFLKWKAPAQTTVNHMLNDLKMELKKKNFKIDSVGTWACNYQNASIVSSKSKQKFIQIGNRRQ